MNITPFQGYRYDAAVVSDAAICISPPYDVIDADQRNRLYQQSPYNIAHVIKAVPMPGDNDSNNMYTRAGQTLRDFLRKGALKQDSQKSIYVYAQEFTIKNSTYRRTGFVALGQLQAYGKTIKPHEQTLTGPKTDRLNLMRTTKAQTGQIFMLYSDPQKKIDALLTHACSGKELLNSRDEDNVTHRLYAITDPQQINIIKEVMADKSVFIADGHHRYETALNYYQETKNPAAAYCMMTFVNTHNEGLVILPTHRLVKNIPDFDASALVAVMREHFDVASMKFTDIVDKKAKMRTMLTALALEFENKEHALGMYFNDGAFYVATLRSIDSMEAVAADKSLPWRQLDVAILHLLVLEKHLGIDQAALMAETNVEYIKDIGQAGLLAIDKVDSGQAQGLFFMNPTSPDMVEAVAQHGEKMPQKSTFFYPKVFSGLVLNILD